MLIAYRGTEIEQKKRVSSENSNRIKARPQELLFEAVGARGENRNWNKMLLLVKQHLEQPGGILSHHLKGEKVIFDQNSPLRGR